MCLQVRVTKPRVPESLLEKYERMEIERTALLIAQQRKRVIEKREETAKIVATIGAKKIADVSAIKLEQNKAEKRTAQEIQTLEDKIHSAHQQALADAQFYTSTKQAEVNKLKLSKEFLQMEVAKALSKVTKTYYGTKPPNMQLVDQVLAGNEL